MVLHLFDDRVDAATTHATFLHGFPEFDQVVFRRHGDNTCTGWSQDSLDFRYGPPAKKGHHAVHTGVHHGKTTIRVCKNPGGFRPVLGGELDGRPGKIDSAEARCVTGKHQRAEVTVPAAKVQSPHR